MNIEQLLGRRPRPWWGRSPIRMILRGAVQGAVFAVVAYGCMRINAGSIDSTELGLEDKQEWIERAAGIVLILAIIGVVYSAVRIVVGVLDLFTRCTVNVTIIRVAERKYGDFLPAIVQHLIWSYGNDSRGDRKEDRRRIRLQLSAQTEDGVRSWTVDPNIAGGLTAGQDVQLRATTLLGHVSKVT